MNPALTAAAAVTALLPAVAAAPSQPEPVSQPAPIHGPAPAGPGAMPGWSDAGPYGWPGCVVNYDDTVIVCPHSRVYLAPSITWAAHARPGTYHRVTLFDKDN